MPVAVGNAYSAASGLTIYAGRSSAPVFDSVSIVSEDAGVPYLTPGQVPVISLHGSGGSNLITGRQFSAAVSGPMAYDTHTAFRFSAIRTGEPNVTMLRPVDNYGLYPGNGTKRESMWLGFKNLPDATIRMITRRRLEAMISWVRVNVPNIVVSKLCMTGGSMGGWGTIVNGLRRPDLFAALYPDRPRWRYSYASGTVAIPDYTGILSSVTTGSAPSISAEDGGGSFATHLDCTTYASNTANRIPWVGWCVGRNDGFMQFQDHVDAVVALRAAKRGFAFAWNNGDHTTGSIISQITASYPYGTFEIGKGYPLFTGHSGDLDPSVDLIGGINVGLSFRNVVESAGSWSCEVTSILGACTVSVEPISDVFVAAAAPKLATITAANSWTPVSFSA